MRLRLDSQWYGNESLIHVLNSEVLNEAKRVERLKDKCDNKYSLYCFDVINTFNCARCVLLLQSLPFVSDAPVRGLRTSWWQEAFSCTQAHTGQNYWFKNASFKLPGNKSMCRQNKAGEIKPLPPRLSFPPDLFVNTGHWPSALIDGFHPSHRIHLLKDINQRSA